jgi:hypothetical protein
LRNFVRIFLVAWDVDAVIEVQGDRHNYGAGRVTSSTATGTSDRRLVAAERCIKQDPDLRKGRESDACSFPVDK